jgi:hybrid cluster-associated redox disulfide protein
MTIGEVVNADMSKAQVLMSFGMGCVGCPSAQGETIGEAATVHGLNLDDLLDALNK